MTLIINIRKSPGTIEEYLKRMREDPPYERYQRPPRYDPNRATGPDPDE